jgi:hypothetical protein
MRNPVTGVTFIAFIYKSALARAYAIGTRSCFTGASGIATTVTHAAIIALAAYAAYPGAIATTATRGI